MSGSAASAAASSRSTAGLAATASTAAATSVAASDPSAVITCWISASRRQPGQGRRRPWPVSPWPAGQRAVTALTGQGSTRARTGRGRCAGDDGAALAAAGVADDLDELAGLAAQDVAQRRQGGQAQPLRDARRPAGRPAPGTSVMPRSASSGPSCVVAYMSCSAISRRRCHR